MTGFSLLEQSAANFVVDLKKLKIKLGLNYALTAPPYFLLLLTFSIYIGRWPLCVELRS